MNVLKISLTAVVLINTTIAGAQTTEPYPAPGLSDRERLDNFVRDKRAERARHDLALDQDAKTNWGQINAIVKSSKAKLGVNSSLAVADQEVVSDLLAQDAASHLVNMGVRVQDVRAAERAGFDPVNAAIRFIRAESTIEDRFLLAPIAAIGRVSSVRFEDLADGYGSTVVINVRDWLSPTQAATNVEVRQLSGVDGRIYSSDILQPTDGDQVFLFSPAAYELGAKRRGKSARKGQGDTIRGVVSGYDVFDIFGSTIRMGGESIEIERARTVARVF
jgi:hypothetical protein